MEARPTREITTSNGHTVVLNDYITGEENRQIRAIYIRSLKKPEAEQDSAAIEFEADNKSFELCVVSVKGPSVKDGASVVEAVLGLPFPDFKEVVAEVGEIVEGKKKSERASSTTSATGD
jgi:hypothetical protein